MSRVHDALRKAGATPAPSSQPAPAAGSPVAGLPPFLATETRPPTLLEEAEEIEFNPPPDAHLIVGGQATPLSGAPSEEFRSLRTRMNHLQTLQPIRTVVVTSPSPAEGKSFTAANLAIAEAQLADNPTLLADFDFRRPVLHTYFNLSRAPGLTDYLQERVTLREILKKVAGLNLYVLTAGEPVINPLELLNLARCKQLLEELARYFKWVIIDTPPLLYASDANLLGTLCHGTLLVVRIGVTTIESVTRAVQTLCENNLLGVVANAARRGELYRNYSGYYYYYHSGQNGEPAEGGSEAS
jgi:capsular exopolysaccharide synthesis family protein